MRPDQETLTDVVRACRLIVEFSAGLDRERFLGDLKTQSSVVHQLLVLGEAAKRLSARFRELHRDLPWSAMAGMRDKLIHAYDEVDLEEVWRTAEIDIPNILRRLGSIVPPNDE